MVGKVSRPVILTPAYWKHDYYLTAAHLPIPFTLTLGRAKVGCTQSLGAQTIDMGSIYARIWLSGRPNGWAAVLVI
jgi:hypothetical protein